MADVGWVWEGQGLDPGVHPSIFGLGEGADFFGLRKVHFLFHPTTALALDKLRDKDEVVCDISKWKFRDTDSGGSEHYVDSALESVCAEAEAVSRWSLEYANVTGGFYDDMKGLMEREGHGEAACARVYAALKSHNPELRLECVVYAHELASAAFWGPLAQYIDVVSFWVWGYENLATLDADIDRCRERFPGKPIVMGCYLRDYPSASPMPMGAIRSQCQTVWQGLEDGRLAGFDILGAVLIDGQIEQAVWVRDFIRAHS
ncbi:MAG: hypothetical protein JXR94_02410 [Candidatus Hydrogenedentes bacterium]|nr:hypothetical protein [Candidatus Hydrogenedentota bacterium]